MQNAPITPASAAGSIVSTPGQRHAAARDDQARSPTNPASCEMSTTARTWRVARLEAAEIVGDAPHQRRREREQNSEHYAGEATCATPIIASRVTSAASCSSLSRPCPRAARAARGSGSRRSSPTRAARRPGSSSSPNSLSTRARLRHDARAVGVALVPGGRQPEHGPGIAGAERADDHVVHLAACSRRRPCARPRRRR